MKFLSTICRLLSLTAPLALLGLIAVMANFTHNVSDSAAPVGWYRVDWGAPAKEGDLVLLRGPIKQVLALPGMHVRFAPEGIYREGKLIPNTAPEAGLPHYPFGEYVVPDNFFVGDGTLDPDSWGSRYIGFIPLSIIAGTVTAKWTTR
jgi:type IV secretory pathway protease TraF